MKKLVTEMNLARCDALKTVLEVRGIQCFIKNEYSSIEAGVTFARPELWVIDDAQFEEAQAILREEETQHVKTGDAQEQALANDEPSTPADEVRRERCLTKVVVGFMLALIAAGVIYALMAEMRQSTERHQYYREYELNRRSHLSQTASAPPETTLFRPNSWRAYYTRAYTKEKKGDLDGAIADFNHAIEINPKHAEIHVNRGVAKAKKGDLDGAIADFDHAIELDAKNLYAYWDRGLAKSKKSDYDGAIADYSHAIELDPREAGTYYSRGYARHRKGDLDEAVADYTHAIELNPKHVYALLNRGNAKLAQGNLKEALVDSARARELAPKDVYIVVGTGFIAHAQCRYEEAEVEYEKALKIDPNNYEARIGLGAIAHAQGRYKDAVAEYQKALEFVPEDAAFRRDIHLRMAWSCLQQNSLARAEQELGEADRAGTERFSDIIAFDRAIIRARQGDAPEALRLWREALRSNKGTSLYERTSHAIFSLAAGKAEDGLAEMQKILTNTQVPAEDIRAALETLDVLKRCQVKLEGLDRMIDLVKSAKDR